MHKNNIFILKQNKLIIQGSRNFSDGLWDVKFPLVTPSPVNNAMNINYIIIKNKSKSDLARYLHGTVFSSSLTTFIKAIKMKILLLDLV